MANRQRRGTRRDGTNPRALGTNERATARNKWALRNWKRKNRAARKSAMAEEDKD